MNPRHGKFEMPSKTFWMVVTLAVVGSQARAQTAEDDFADFRIPEHRSRGGSVSLQGGFSRGSGGSGGFQQRDEGANGQIQSSIRGFLDSEPSQHSWQAGAAFDGNRQWGRSIVESPGTRTESETSRRQTGESWFLSGEHRRYFGERSIAVGAAAFVAGTYFQSWERSSQLFSTPPTLGVDRRSNDEDVYHTDASLSVTAGVGRVRDATGIYDAYVLEERLRATGALTRPLSRSARQKIAALHYARPEYFAGTERPEKLFWRDVERVLREDGALREGGLDAYDVLRALETRYPAGETRMRGAFVGPVLSAAHRDQIARFEFHDEFRTYTGGAPTGLFETRLSDRLEVSDDQILPGIQAETHRPLGMRVQLDGAARVLVPMLHVEKGLQTQASGRASWFLHERWLAALEAAYDRSYQSGDPGRASFDGWTVRYGVTLVYYLQDHLSADLRILEQQNRSFVSSFSRSGLANLGLTYAFWRGFDAPGLTDPVRPISNR